MAYQKGLTAREYASLLEADFSSLEGSRNIILNTLQKMIIKEYNRTGGGGMSQRAFAQQIVEDTNFGEVVRLEIGKVLSVVAARQRAKVPSNKSGLERGFGYGVWKKELGGSVGFHSTGRGRKESVKRVWEPGKIARFHQKRTQEINEYYGRDRAFVLRILNFGTDVRTAKSPLHGRGTGATWGRRGAISPAGFFHSMSSDMQRAAQELGTTLEGYAEKFIEKAFEEIK